MKRRITTLLVLAIIISSVTWTKARAALTAPTLTQAYRKSDTITVKWEKISGVTGYQVRYSFDEDMAEPVKIKVKGRKNNKTAIEKADTTKNYFIQVRAYKVTDGKTTVSRWSNKVCVLGWDKTAEYAKNSKIHEDGACIYYASGKNATGITVCVNAGHGTAGGNKVKTLCHPDGSPKVTGGSTAKGAKEAAAVSSGTTFLDGITEAAVTLELAKAVKEKLLAEGYNVLMIRSTSDIQLDNVARTVLANNYADYHIALHYDSSENDKGAFYISVPDNKTYRNMNPVSENYKKHHKLGDALLSGFREAGVKIWSSGKMALDLTQTSYSTIPSVDVEVGDRASAHDEKTLKKISEGTACGIKKLK
jgi:N-acetylmuramoyl-L-alanine amidase